MKKSQLKNMISMYKTLSTRDQRAFFEEIDLFGDGASIYESLQTVGLYHADLRLLDLLSSEGVLVLPQVDRYLEEPMEDDFKKCIRHFLKAHKLTTCK